MTVGVMQARLILREARSLKDKRQVIKSVKDRLRARLNVSVAETAFQDIRQRAELSVAVVSTDRRHAESQLHQALGQIRAAPGAEIASHEIEYY